MTSPCKQGSICVEPVDIPRLIDEPPSVLLWTTDEMAPIMLGLVIGMFTGNVLILTGLGLAVTSLYKRFRDGRPDGYLLHLLYWIGVLPTKAKTIPNPYANHFKP